MIRRRFLEVCMKQGKSFLSVLVRISLLLALVLPALPQGSAVQAAPVAPAGSAAAPEGNHQPAALTNTISLRVSSARSEPFWGAPLGDPNSPGILQGDPILEYRWIINQDNTGDPFQDRYPECAPYEDEAHTITNTVYPANCNWPSISAVPSNSPIVTQGDHASLSETETLTLPDGQYLISVISEDFKIDGQWFTLPMEESAASPGVAQVDVTMHPFPLPTATATVQVFEDNALPNSAPDIPAERGLEGFAGHIADWGGEITSDAYGNPLCTEYEVGTGPNGYQWEDGAPVPIVGTGGHCLSNANGVIRIPNLGTNRFEVWVVPPDGTDWTQTTTLEGNKPWDTWLQEGATGLDTEFVIANEPFPFTIFGFIQPTDALTDTTPTGEVRGVVAAAEVYIPFMGGLPYLGQKWGGLSGAKISHPIDRPWVALSDLQGGDTAVWVGRGNADGSFSIPNVPDGDYMLTYWDDENLYILDLRQISVNNGEVLDVGVIFLTGWFTHIDGHVFIDDNENGKMDPGEHGQEEFPLVLRRRDNSEMDRGAILQLTSPGGYYEFKNTYPLNQWVVLEAYADNYYVTGVTFQASNQPEETTILGNGVDVGVLPVIGQSGRIDWGIKAYETGTNGGIAGTVFYDTTRNEINPALQAVEPWAPGIAGLRVNLYASVRDGEGNFVKDADGSFMKGQLLAWTETETWERPKNCQARDADGNAIDQLVLPPATGDYDCLEGMLMGTQFQADFATVDGNYGFGEIFTDTNGVPLAEPLPIPPGDYLVEVEVPNDAFGRPLYQVGREEDVNVYDGVTYVPQIPPPACAGALHEVDVMGVGTDGPNAVYNPAFAAEGGSPYEGQMKPLCDVKLVTVSNGRSIAPGFTYFTEVPIPSRHWGIILDDLTLSTNPLDLLFGEKAGIPNIPIGYYDYANRLLTTVHSDPNGYFQVLVPSTTTINCPSPSGVCAGMYRLVGNDPGQPGNLNALYNPQYRTISANFEAFPGVGIVADLAPTQVAVSIQAPGSQFNHPATCRLDDATPQFFAVDKPYVYWSGTPAERTITIQGKGFGAEQRNGQVSLGRFYLNVQSWSDREITAIIPPNVRPGAHQLDVRVHNGQHLVNGITIHVLGTGYSPSLLEVGPGMPYSIIQSALEDAALVNEALVIVYPGTPEQWNPKGVYYENLVVHSPVKLQGIGPGGVYSQTDFVLGSVVSGLTFGGDTGTADAWRTLVANLNWVGNQQVYEGAVVTVFAESETQFTPLFNAAIDGFTIEGGDQQGFPNNINEIGGGNNGQPANVVVQGGGIFVNGYARYLRITNNVLQNNGGAYAGAIRLGTPNLAPDDPAKDAQNDRIFVGNNMILANGGTNLAGAIGVFDGAERYEIAYNDLCGNFSAEYGGGISHYGFSPNSSIHNNRIYFNRSYDEGGGVFVAGELPINPATTLSPGAGPVDIYDNIIQANLANDDGGGLRFLMAGNFSYNVYNNFILNNISTHEGGGVSLNDAPNVRLYNNTVMKNTTTATALTSNGQPAPAGLSTSRNSDLLQATLPAGSPTFSNPLLFNNIFWDNRAGSWDGAGVAGIGITGDPNPINYWDMGLADMSGAVAPTNSIISSTVGTALHPSNLVGSNPLVRESYDTTVDVMPWRTNPNFVGVIMVAVDLPPNLMGDYHLQSASPAVNAGASLKDGVRAPRRDIDGDRRPSSGGYEIGADELGPLSGFLTVIPGAAADPFVEVFLPLVFNR